MDAGMLKRHDPQPTDNNKRLIDTPRHLLDAQFPQEVLSAWPYQ